MKRNAIHAFFLILGIASLGVAVFAGTPAAGELIHWGKGRWLLLIIGSLLVFGSLFSYFAPEIIAATRSRIWAFVHNLPVPSAIRSNRDLAYVAGLCRRYIFAVPVVLLVVGIYLWVCTASMWLYRRPLVNGYGYYYDLQAQAFRAGEFSLPLKPLPAVLALPNPYDPQERESLPLEEHAPLDLSLYKGEYYEYWGPVPALLINVLRPIYHGQFHDGISDPELVFGFLSALFICECLLILLIWEHYFRQLPNWILLVSILLAGLVTPSIDSLTRTIPGNASMVYQVAITSGQFFLISGFLAAFLAIDRNTPSRGWLVAAGTLWALAVGSRNILVMPVAVFALMIVWRLYWMRKRALAVVAQDLIPLGLPLVCGAVALAWYNWARFGSISETGVSYILSGPYDLQKHLGEFFSPIYLVQNLYNNLLMPFQVRAQFPYLNEANGSTTPLFSFYKLPQAYATNRISGVLFTAPFCLFALAPVAHRVFSLIRHTPGGDKDDEPGPKLITWVVLGLAGGFLAIFVTLQLFLWAAMRYVEDFMPALILLSVIGFWQGLNALGARTVAGRWYLALGMALALITLTVGILLPMGNNPHSTLTPSWFTNPLLLGWFSQFTVHP